jgi:hypothetical protein
MTNVNYEWINQQFTAAKVRVGTGKAVLKLLKAWEDIDVTPEQAKDIFEILGKVAQGHALVQTPGNEVWVQAQPGQLKIGEVVRVRSNAFDGDRGVSFNGKVGVIGAIRSGDIIFNSADKTVDGVHFRPADLEKRVR